MDLGQKMYLKVNMMAFDCLGANLVSGTKQDAFKGSISDTSVTLSLLVFNAIPKAEH